MSNEPDQIKLHELSQKKVAFYQTMLAAFIETKNNFDKQVLTISVTAIGFLLGMSEKLISGYYSKTLLTFSTVLFLVSTLGLLRVFTLNSKYIEEQIRSESEKAEQTTKSLDQYDLIIKCAFGFAILIAVVLVVLHIFNLEV